MQEFIKELLHVIKNDERHTFDGCINKSYVLGVILQIAAKHSNPKLWIDVKERPPAEKCNIITGDYCVYPVIFEACGRKDIRFYAYGKGHWLYHGVCMDKYVTHWLDVYKIFEEETDDNISAL